MTTGEPEPAGTVAATAVVGGDPTAIFGYDTGDQMISMPAPERRVVFLRDDTAAHLTGDGWSLLDAAVDWAMNLPGANAAPQVDAGADQTPTAARSRSRWRVFSLAGSVVDDGKPAPPAATTTVWSGPTGVVFDDPADPDTGVALPGAGSYTLTLTADDGELVAADTVVVTAHPPRVATFFCVGPREG